MITGMPVESSVRGDVHAEFGGRAGETDQPRGWHRAPARPYVFRWNRSRHPMAGFQTLLGLGATREPTTYDTITGAKDIPEIVFTPSRAVAGDRSKRRRKPSSSAHRAGVSARGPCRRPRRAARPRL